MKDNKSGIIPNLSALGIADIGTAVIGGAFWLIIATLIGPEEYGKVTYLLSIVGISFSICLIGIRETIIVYTIKKNPITPTIFVITGISALIGFTALSGIFSNLFLNRRKDLLSKYSSEQGFIYLISDFLIESTKIQHSSSVLKNRIPLIKAAGHGRSFKRILVNIPNVPSDPMNKSNQSISGLI